MSLTSCVASGGGARGWWPASRSVSFSRSPFRSGCRRCWCLPGGDAPRLSAASAWRDSEALPGLYWFLVHRKTPRLFWRARLGWHEGSSRTMPSIRAPASKQTATLQVRHHYHTPVDGLAPGKLHSRCLTASIAHRVRNCNRDDAFRLQVAVKCRPLTDTEQRRSRHIIQVIDDKVPPALRFWCVDGFALCNWW